MKNLLKGGVFVAVTILFFIPVVSFAAINFDAAASSPGQGVSNGSSIFPITIGSESNRVLICAVYYNPSDSSQPTVTYHSVSMTQLPYSGYPESDISGGLFYLLNPDAGTNNIVMSDTTSRPIAGSCASYTGVESIDTNYYATSTGDGGPSGQNVSINTLSDQSWVVLGVASGQNNSAGTNVIQRSSGGGDRVSVYDSNKGVTVGNYTVGSVGDASNNIYLTAVAMEPVPPTITLSGTVNKLVKFSNTTSLTNSLLSDDGSNTTLTSGNFFMPVGSIFDSISNGSLNFGTSLATTMTFGRTGQNMVINSNVGIGTTTPVTTLDVNGSFLASVIKVIANGLGLDTYSPGSLSIGSTTATSVIVGHSGITTTVLGSAKLTNVGTISNCASTASPAMCDSAPAGSVVMQVRSNLLVVNSTAVTANSEIFVTEDSSLGPRLGITCNPARIGLYNILARVPGKSFTIESEVGIITGNKVCLSYFIVN